ncbi:MAG: hypothetical protein PHX21_05265 [bacterium]|nr:hypothetical protein [bacterium]
MKEERGKDKNCNQILSVGKQGDFCVFVSRYEEVKRLFIKGWAITKISQITGIDKKEVEKYKNIIEKIL